MARTLQEWETYITPLFKRVQLLGEIPLNQVEFEALSDEIRALVIHAPNIHEATRRLAGRNPLTFATFLAHFAAHNTHREFWDALGQQIGSSGSDLNNAQWRAQFFKILQENKKRDFSELGGNKYVTSMRIHGGIPVYSLDDFFANMLLPSIEKPEFIPLIGAELRDSLLKRSTVQVFTDSIVRNYFETTENIGIEFLETCRCMARHYHKEQLIPPGLDLPAYVVEAYVNFMEGQQDERVRLKRPRLLFDDTEGILLELPEQTLSGVLISTVSEAYWFIQTGDTEYNSLTEKVRFVSSGREKVTEERQITLSPTPHVHVSFVIQGEDNSLPQTLRRWTFGLLPDSDGPQLLLFRRRDSSLVRWGQFLPAEELLLLYPCDSKLEFEGESRLLHQPDSLFGGWSSWHAEYWSLSAGLLRIIRNDQETALIPIQTHAAIPQLVGAKPFEFNADPKDVPLFIGEIPRLRIPIRASHIEERKRWNIDINSVWEANPQIHINTSLDNLSEHIQQEEEFLELNLATLLGESPTGTFKLWVRNAFEIDIEYPLRLWDDLRIRDLPEIILPSLNPGGKPEEILLDLLQK
ncbi:MAG: hypothetical protein WCK35_06695 [Chloroflexota bacterium]